MPFGLTRESTANARVAEVHNKLSRKINELEKDLASQKTTNKVTQLALLSYIQQLAITKGDASPALLAKINAKFVELGGNTTPEENKRLVEATSMMNLDSLVNLLFDGVQLSITEA